MNRETAVYLEERGFTRDWNHYRRWTLKDPVFGNIQFYDTDPKLLATEQCPASFLWNRDDKRAYRIYCSEGRLQSSYEKLKKGISRVLSSSYALGEKETSLLVSHGFERSNSSFFHYPFVVEFNSGWCVKNLKKGVFSASCIYFFYLEDLFTELRLFYLEDLFIDLRLLCQTED